MMQTDLVCSVDFKAKGWFVVWEKILRQEAENIVRASARREGEHSDYSLMPCKQGSPALSSTGEYGGVQTLDP